MRAYVDTINSKADAANVKDIRYTWDKDACLAIAAALALEVNPACHSIMNACANIKYLELLTDNKEEKKLCREAMRKLLAGGNQLRNAVKIIDMGSYSEDIGDADNGLDMLGVLAEVYPAIKFVDLPFGSKNKPVRA